MVRHSILILERMKKRGFAPQKITEKLHEKGIAVEAQNLAKYLTEFRTGACE